MVRTVSFTDILDAPNAAELIAEYAAECSLPELGPVSPQREMYAAMERAGSFQCFGVFERKTLAGFATVLTYVVPHYGRKIATVESLFLTRKQRRGSGGAELMKAIETYGRGLGCAAVLYSAPAGGQLERVLSARKSYRHSNTVFLRAL